MVSVAGLDPDLDGLAPDSSSRSASSRAGSCPTHKRSIWVQYFAAQCGDSAG